MKARAPRRGSVPPGMRSMALLMVLLGCGSTQRPDGGEGLLKPGASAPALQAVDHRGKPVRLPPDQPTVVFFYPKDGSPGCTKEACAFRDVWQRYESAGVQLLGVSADSVEDHREFAEQHKLPFAMVSDEEHRWADAFGVGTVFGMIRRVTFVIAADGRIETVYPDVDPGVHAMEILQAMEPMNTRRAGPAAESSGQAAPAAPAAPAATEGPPSD